jgi:hypothetical protein
LPPISRYELAAALPLVPVTPGVPLTLPAAPLDPDVAAAPEPFATFMRMNPPGVADADAEPAVPGAPLPMRHPVTVIGCG